MDPELIEVRLNNIFSILILTLAVSLTACSNSDQRLDELRVGLAQPPMSLDPRFATDAASHRVQEFIHRGLVHLDARFLPRPDLARTWEHPDPLSWKFVLREGIRFHDGTPVTAPDVVATLKSVLDPGMASPLRAGFEAVQSVEAVSDRVLVIHLRQPDASILTRLSLGVLPARLAALPQSAHTTVGCGPFRLIRWDQNGLVLARVPNSGRDVIRRIRFQTVKDPVTRCLKLARGEIDFIQNDLPPGLLPYLRRQPNLTIQTMASTTFSYIGINLHDPKLSDVRVRRALAMALDRKRLKKALFGDLPLLAETVLSPSHWAASPVPAVPYTPRKAEALLDSAGFPRAKDGVRMRLTYRTSTDPARLRLVTAIASQWQRIGVDIKIESMEWGGFYARIKRGDFQLFSLAWVSIRDPDIYRWILHSSMWPPTGANRGRYANAEVDAWLDQARRSEDKDRRKELYAKVQRKMAEDQVYIPLWYDPVIAVSGPGITGFRPDSDGSLLGLIQAKLLP